MKLINEKFTDMNGNAIVVEASEQRLYLVRQLWRTYEHAVPEKRQ